MPYTPRPATTVSCAHCSQPFESRNLRRKYCSNSCNVLASYARNGTREARPSKADLERSLITLIELMTGKERAAAPTPEQPGLAEAKERVQKAAAALEPKPFGLAEAKGRMKAAVAQVEADQKRKALKEKMVGLKAALLADPELNPPPKKKATPPRKRPK